MSDLGLEALLQAEVEKAWEAGCPVASDPAQIATISRRRLLSASRRIGESPSPAARILDLRNGLIARLESAPEDPGPLAEDYAFLARRLVSVYRSHEMIE